MPAVHFSHHVCGQYREHERFEASWRASDYPLALGRPDQSPFVGCGRARNMRSVPTYSADPNQVTCKRCRRYLDQYVNVNLYRPGTAICRSAADHREQIKRAWLTCCRHRGEAWPFDADELASVNRARHVKAFSMMWQITVGERVPGVAADGAAELIRRVNDLATHINPTLANAMRPAIAELLLAAEWIDQVAACLQRGEQLVESVFSRIRNGEISLSDDVVARWAA